MGMDFSSLFALPDGLEVAEASITGPVLTLSLVAIAPTAMCPLCGQQSTHRRSTYTRHVADVPAGKNTMSPGPIRRSWPFSVPMKASPVRTTSVSSLL